MKKIISRNIPREHYQAQAVIVWCFDDRFSGLLSDFVKERRFEKTDVVKVAGGIKDLASPEKENDKAYLLGQIRKSVALHQPDTIVLAAHEDCGAYGGRREADFYHSELKKAAEVVERHFPDVKILLCYADFSGLFIA